MKHQLITVTVPAAHADRVCGTFDEIEAERWWRTALEGTDATPDRVLITIVAKPGEAQPLMDRIGETMEDAGVEGWHQTLSTLDAVDPDMLTEEDEAKLRTTSITAAREELLARVRENAALTPDYALMVALSTVVAAIGLNTDQIAAVIGAMVIAPFLGPLMGLALAVALGMRRLLLSGITAAAAGVVICLAVSAALSIVLPVDPSSGLLDYAQPLSPAALVLALAAGAAAALATASDRGTAMVGVMVAAAILPPLVAVGLLLASGQSQEAARAGVLAFANMICLTLSAQIVFAAKGIRPRHFSELKETQTSVRLNIATLSALIAGLAIVLWFWDVV